MTTKTIIITPGMVGTESIIAGVTQLPNTDIGLPCWNFPADITSGLRLGIPIPLDWNGDTIIMEALYTSNGVSGTFKTAINGTALNVGSTTPLSILGAGVVLDSPLNLAELKKMETPLGIPTTIDLPEYFNVIFRRIGSAVDDTSISSLQVVSFTFKYNSNQ